MYYNSVGIALLCLMGVPISEIGKNSVTIWGGPLKFKDVTNLGEN
jgi:hypothetical protein